MGSSLVGSSLPHKYYIKVEVTNTLAYYDTATIATATSFIAQAPEL